MRRLLLLSVLSASRVLGLETTYDGQVAALVSGDRAGYGVSQVDGRWTDNELEGREVVVVVIWPVALLALAGAFL